MTDFFIIFAWLKTKHVEKVFLSEVESVKK